ncbi:serine-rich adhesin for platelets-like isoform X3 [Mytilus edulis]
MLNKENSAKSSKDKFRAVIVKGKDFVKSKVNSCRDRFSRNSMKEVKKRLSNVTEDESEKGSNSCGNHRGSYSGAPQDQEQSNTEQMGTSADLKTIDMSCDKDVKEADWSGQNGNSKYENEENFMILPEVYTKYNGVSNENMGQNHSQEKTDKIKENNGDITDGQKNGNQVEIVVVDEEENDYGNVGDGDEEDQTVLDEAIPLGSEAQSFEESTRTETSQLEVPVDKKLKWLLGNLEQHSFGSDLSQNTATSNSSDISVDMLLNERSNDPEEILTNLGFGEGEEGNNPNVRIPGRFKADQSGAEGVSITEFLGDNPELSQLLQAISDQQEGGGENLELHTKDMDAMMAAGQGNPNYGNMLNSVMHGMKFLNLLSSAKSLNNLGEKPEEHPSILQNPKNREFLAQQGFYDRHKKKSRSESEAKANKLSRTQSLDASEKRKKFQATKSRNYSSLQNVPEQDEVFDPQKNGAGNYYSFGTSVGTGRSSSTDNYRPSMTSIETSTDSYDSGDSPGYTGRNGSSRSEPYLIQSEQMNIADSGIWNTEDSQRSVDEEYLSEFTRDSAIQRKSQVERMMSEDCYNVGDDTDILQSPPFSRTGSLESTLTASGIHKLETKSSTLKGHESFDDDVDIYSESYLPDKKNSIENGTEYADSIQRQLIEAESIKKEKFSPNTSMSKPESASGWKKFQRRYGVEMQINVPGVKNEADMANNNYEFCRKSENEIPVDGIQTDKPGLGVIGKIESVQSDSSGFAEAENVMPEPVVIQRVSSLGSSTESDQTFKSSITILPTKSSAPKMSVTSPDGTQSISLDISGSESFSSSSKVDIAVGTDDFSEYLHAPNICYHLHERDGDDSGTYSENNKSVVLTIELPKNWVNSNPNKKIGKPRVISHLYKEIGHPTRSQSLDTTDSEANDEVVVMRRHRGQSNYPLERAASDSHVPIDFPPRSSTPHGGHSRSIRDSIMFAESAGSMPTDFPMQLLSTPHGHSRSIRDSIYLAETKQTFFPNQLPPRSTSPTSLSAFSAFGSVPRRTGSNREHLESDSNLNLSSVSLVSQTDSVSSTSSGSLEYYKLMKLVNQPVSFKTDSKGRKGNIRFVPKFSVKEWTQLKKHQQLEEETKLAQHTLQRYKAELNMMESQFLVKTQLVKDDLSYSDREDVQELQYLFGELRKEMLLTEETLANRLDGINMGNDNYNPMLALDVIRKMTELLREQSYQQQMVTEKDEETMETTHSATWRSSGSQRLSEAKPRGSISDLDSEHSFSSSLSELKETILTEVRQELYDNTQWLHKELQKKERELNALKMELMSTNIKSGTTRKKHFYESDV